MARHLPPRSKDLRARILVERIEAHNGAGTLVQQPLAPRELDPFYLLAALL